MTSSLLDMLHQQNKCCRWKPADGVMTVNRDSCRTHLALLVEQPSHTADIHPLFLHLLEACFQPKDGTIFCGQLSQPAVCVPPLGPLHGISESAKRCRLSRHSRVLATCSVPYVHKRLHQHLAGDALLSSHAASQAAHAPHVPQARPCRISG